MLAILAQSMGQSQQAADLLQQNQQYAEIGLVVLMLIGVFFLLFGYRMFKIMLAIVGFLVGFALGAAGMAAAYPDGGVLYPIIGGFIAGVIGGALFYVLYYVGIFLMGASALGGVAAGVLLGLGTDMSQPGSIGIVAAAAIGGGVLAILIQKFIIICLTAFGGAVNIVTGAMYFLGAMNRQQFLSGQEQQAMSQQNALLALGAWFVVGLLGVILQYTVFARKKKQPVPVGGYAPPPPPPPPGPYYR